MKRPEPELTQEQLALAWRHLRRPGRPATLEEALAHPWLGTCVRGLARSLSRAPFGAGNTRRPPTPPGAPPVPPTPSGEYVRRGPTHMQAPRFDVKRAAANDLDD